MDYSALRGILQTAIETHPDILDLVNTIGFQAEGQKKLTVVDFPPRPELIEKLRSLPKPGTHYEQDSKVSAVIISALAQSPNNTVGHLACERFDDKDKVVLMIWHIIRAITPNEKSEIIQRSTNQDSFMSKLRQLAELGHHFDPVRQALEVLRNLNRDEDHDEWDSYDWQDWREFNKKIRDRETRFGFDHHFRSTWFRLNSDLDNTASDFELSRNVTPFLEHIQAVIKAMVARWFETRAFYDALSTLCKIGKMIVTSSSSPLHVEVSKWFASNTVLEKAILDITNAMELHQLVLIFEDMTG